MASANNIAPADAVKSALNGGDEFLRDEIRFSVVDGMGTAALYLEMPRLGFVDPSVYQDASQVADELPDRDGADAKCLWLELHKPGTDHLELPWKKVIVYTGNPIRPQKLRVPLETNTDAEWNADEIAQAIIGRFQKNLADIGSNPKDKMQMKYYKHLQKVVTRLGLQDILLPPEQQ